MQKRKLVFGIAMLCTTAMFIGCGSGKKEVKQDINNVVQESSVVEHSEIPNTETEKETIVSSEETMAQPTPEEVGEEKVYTDGYQGGDMFEYILDTGETVKCVVKRDTGGLNVLGIDGMDYVDITIPGQIGERTVELVSQFTYCETLQKVTLPKTVKEISDGAFGKCSNLSEVIIPEDVELTIVGSSAFEGTAWLDIQKQNSPLVILGNVLYDGKSCTDEHVVVPERITIITAFAFENCKNLIGIELPNGLKEIGGYAFAGCSNLSEISLPDGLRKIGNSSFTGCTSLTEMVIPDTIVELGTRVFEGCVKLQSVELPEGLVTIGGDMFRNCESLSYVEIPSTVTTIGEHAFKQSGITKMVIPDTVKTIEGKYTFEACEKLETVVIGNGIEILGEGVFASCVNLTDVTIPDSVTEIGVAAFRNTGITSVSVRQGTVLKNKAFPDDTVITYR